MPGRCLFLRCCLRFFPQIKVQWKKHVNVPEFLRILLFCCIRTWSLKINQQKWHPGDVDPRPKSLKNEKNLHVCKIFSQHSVQGFTSRKQKSNQCDSNFQRCRKRARRKKNTKNHRGGWDCQVALWKSCH